jgi:hypothetical protein
MLAYGRLRRITWICERHLVREPPLGAWSSEIIYLHLTDIKQSNMMGMMVCIQRRLHTGHIDQAEEKFYSHTLQYLTSMSGQQVELADWMISSFEVDFGPEIGVGGL